jgi:hypothetical protein
VEEAAMGPDGRSERSGERPPAGAAAGERRTGREAGAVHPGEPAVDPREEEGRSQPQSSAQKLPERRG